MACLKPHIANEIKAVLDHGPIVQGRERFLDLLLKENLAYRQRIRPHLLGVHPGNRHSVGLHVNEVHSLLSEICDVGFAEAEVRAICVEVSSSDTATFDFNRKLQHQSQGKLNLSPDAMRYATIAASHLNAALQCIQGCVYHDDERLTVDGKISHEKLGSLDSQYVQASVNGVEWLVISRSLLDEFPQVASMVSASMNVGSHLARQESELELLSKISDVMIAKDKEVLTWAEISTEILKSKPTLASSAPILFKFACKAGGRWLKATLHWCRVHGCSKRTLGVDTYEALCVEVKGANQFSFFRRCSLTRKIDIQVAVLLVCFKLLNFSMP